MQELIDELKKLIHFKDATDDGDVVLIAGDNPRMVVYALVVSIEPDKSRADQWWHVKMNVLSVPPQETTWTLRESQFTGKEIFTMDGDQRFVKAVQFDRLSTPAGSESKGVETKPSSGSNPFRRVK